MGISKKILVVEDVPDISDLVEELFRHEGYEVENAPNGKVALARLRAGPPPCLILLDLTMPVMDGDSFRAEQLKDPALAKVPVYVMSAHRDVAGRAKALGVDGYFCKPFGLDDILAVARACCAKN